MIHVIFYLECFIVFYTAEAQAFSIDISLHAHIFQFCCCCSYPFKASRLNFKRLSEKKKEFNCYMEALGPEFETWDFPGYEPKRPAWKLQLT